MSQLLLLFLRFPLQQINLKMASSQCISEQDEGSIYESQVTFFFFTFALLYECPCSFE